MSLKRPPVPRVNELVRRRRRVEQNYYSSRTPKRESKRGKNKAKAGRKDLFSSPRFGSAAFIFVASKFLRVLQSLFCGTIFLFLFNAARSCYFRHFRF